MEIKLSQGKVALVDKGFYKELSKKKWSYDPKGYAIRNERGASVYMHRVITGAGKGLVVDHINGNGLDNRVGNLRVCSNKENRRNQFTYNKLNKSSLLKGVSKHHTGKWQVHIGIDGVRKYIGLFNDELTAGIAYDLWAKDVYKEFSQLNFQTI